MNSVSILFLYSNEIERVADNLRTEQTKERKKQTPQKQSHPSTPMFFYCSPEAI